MNDFYEVLINFCVQNVEDFYEVLINFWARRRRKFKKYGEGNLKIHKRESIFLGK